MEPNTNRAGQPTTPLTRLGIGLGVAITLIAGLVVLGGGGAAAPIDEAVPPEQPDTDEVATGDEAAGPRREPSGNVEVTASTGETFPTVFTAAATADLILIGAPSRNADLNSLTPVANMFAQLDCASFVSFNAVTLDETSPLEAYLAVFDAIFQDRRYGEFEGPSGTLGGSFTALPAYLAGAQRNATFAIVMSPSDPFPADAPMLDGFEPVVYHAENDLDYAEPFASWQAAGFDSATVPGDDHGTDIFTGADGQDVLADIRARYCG